MPPLFVSAIIDRTTGRPYVSPLQREARLQGTAQTLYHQTSPENAKAILKSGIMLPGSGGLAGGGIYFATTDTDTDHKALSHGVVLVADVRLGQVLTINRNGDSTITFESLQRRGYDSVLIPRTGGREYVVYHPDQVSNIRVFAQRPTPIHASGPNPNGRFRGPEEHLPSGTCNF